MASDQGVHLLRDEVNRLREANRLLRVENTVLRDDLDVLIKRLEKVWAILGPEPTPHDPPLEDEVVNRFVRQSSIRAALDGTS